MVSCLDRAVLWHVTRPALGALIVGLVILFAERLVVLLGLTLGKQNSFTLVLELLAYWLPHYLALSAPFALYFGTIVAFHKMVMSAELEAWQAGGVCLSRLLRPVVVLAVFLSGFALLMFGWIQPHAYYAYRSILFALDHIDGFYLAEEGVFIEVGSRTFILDQLHRQSNTFDHIFLFEDLGKEGISLLMAERGSLSRKEGEVRPTLRLEDVLRFKLPSEIPLSAPLPFAQMTRLETLSTPLGRLEGWVFPNRGERVRERTLPELFRAPKKPPSLEEKREIVSERHKRLASSIFVLLLPFLALPFGIGNRRSPKVWRFVVAAGVLVAFFQMIEQGALATRLYGTSPWLTVWGPIGGMMVFIFWRYWQVCFTQPRPFWRGFFGFFSGNAPRGRRQIP